MKELISLVFIGVLLVVGLTIIFSYPTMILWNLLMPDIFGLPEITFWQTVGLMFLSTALFYRGSK